MACITERQRKDGTSAYRVRFRVRGVPEFTLTFDDWDEACDWVEKNELEFVKDPDKFFKWREENYRVMRRERQYIRSHVIRSKIRRV